MKLPTRKELPDYYEVIRRPVDISKIQVKIDDGKVLNNGTEINLGAFLFAKVKWEP